MTRDIIVADITRSQSCFFVDRLTIKRPLYGPSSFVVRPVRFVFDLYLSIVDAVEFFVVTCRTIRHRLLPFGEVFLTFTSIKFTAPGVSGMYFEPVSREYECFLQHDAFRKRTCDQNRQWFANLFVAIVKNLPIGFSGEEFFAKCRRVPTERRVGAVRPLGFSQGIQALVRRAVKKRVSTSGRRFTENWTSRNPNDNLPANNNRRFVWVFVLFESASLWPCFAVQHSAVWPCATPWRWNIDCPKFRDEFNYYCRARVVFNVNYRELPPSVTFCSTVTDFADEVWSKINGKQGRNIRPERSCHRSVSFVMRVTTKVSTAGWKDTFASSTSNENGPGKNVLRKCNILDFAWQFYVMDTCARNACCAPNL